MWRRLSRLAAKSGSGTLSTTRIGWRNFGNGVPSEKMSIMFELRDHAGSLPHALKFFSSNDISLTRIESRPVPTASNNFKFYVDFNGDPNDPNVIKLVKELKNKCVDVRVTDSKEVPWFPSRAEEADSLSKNIIGSDTGELEADHPGFHDPVYKKRRAEIAKIALDYKYGDEIPRVDYTDQEIECWQSIYQKLIPLYEKHACEEFNAIWPLVEKNCGYSATSIPQLADISKYVKARTGFILRPVAGLLSARDFLYGLAFRIFFCTQYVRHHSKPLYTPEPDVAHEVMGHAPMFAVQEFADFSHQFGLLSIGASDEQIDRIARCYWYTVEFGVVQQQNARKAYGAGLLSSFGELQYMASDEPEFIDWDPNVAAKEPYPITKYQPKYFVAKSFEDAQNKLIEFAERIERPFNVTYDKSGKLHVDSNIVQEPKL
uniref:phenylalanine 4-monooxygenase n=1 Tax=Hirondellea gigas TaxID=1518452 RepID=A0A6A7G669_9CRUS